MMQSIPVQILIHSGTMTIYYDADKWGGTPDAVTAPIAGIRIEPYRRETHDRDQQEVTLTAMMYYDTHNSTCTLPFVLPGDTYNGGKVKQQTISALGRVFVVKTVEPIYDDQALHHYEVGLCG
jgi:hypothetical protein